MASSLSFGVGLVCAFLLVGCGNKGKQAAAPGASHPAVQAPSAITESLSVKLDKNGKPLVVINKASLEKEFLFQSAVMKQPIYAWSKLLRSRIVAFRKFQGRVYMLEATDGHTVSTELPQTLPLFSYAIVEETNDSITVDMNDGMRKYYSGESLSMADTYNPGEQFKSEYLENAFFEKAEVVKNALVIRQVGQGGGVPTALKYFLRPHVADSTYQPELAVQKDTVGHFNAAAMARPGGGSQVYVAKHNINKPIIFAVSSNTPPQYKQAVKDGILYWNRALGKDLIQAIDAPEGASAPDLDFNIVQWVNWDDAPYAFADFDTHPRTGQMLRAQVHLAFSRVLDNRRDAQKIINHARSHAHDATKEVSHHASCDDGLHKQETALREVLMTVPNDAAIRTAMIDYVSRLTAHEVGHALGFLHQFASNVNSVKYPWMTSTELFREVYVDNKPLAQDVIPATSVMDYHRIQEGALLGYGIRHKFAALPYDRKTAQALYFPKQEQAIDNLIYCRDEEKNAYIDCLAYDGGNSPVEFGAMMQKTALSTLHQAILDEYRGGKFPSLGIVPKAPETIALEPSKFAKGVASADGALGALLSKPKFLRVRRQFPMVGPLNLAEVEKKEHDYVVSEVARVSGGAGLKAIFPVPTIDRIHQSEADFLQVTDPSANPSLSGPMGEVFTFQNSELTTIREQGAKLYAELPNQVASTDIEIWAKAPDTWKESDRGMADSLLALCVERVQEYVLKTKPGQIEAAIEVKLDGAAADAAAEKRTVRLPHFAYSTTTRASSLKLLGPGSTATSKEFGKAAKDDVKKAFLALVTEVIGGLDILKVTPANVRVTNVDGRDDANLTATVRSWIADNRSLAGSL